MLPLLAVLAIAATSAAQSNLFTNPDIAWIGAFTTDYRFDPALPSGVFQETRNWNTLAVEKLLVPPLPSGFPGLIDGMELFWKLKVSKMLTSPEIAAFEDPLLTKPMPENAINEKFSWVDTIYSFDSEKYEEQIQLVRNYLSIEDLAGIRIFQQVYFRKSTRSIGYQSVSWAPFYWKPSNGSDSTVSRPICWLPAFPAENPELLRHSEDVSYVFVTTTGNQSPTLEEITLVKGAVDFRELFSDFIRKPWAPAYAAADFEELSVSDLLRNFDTGMDTIIVFDPVTFEETVAVTQHESIGERVHSIRFTVRWFYDDRKRQLYYAFVGLAPSERILDEEGNFLFSKALFYIKGE